MSDLRTHSTHPYGWGAPTTVSDDETYNGWKNRETWALALHLNNDQGLQDMARATAESAFMDSGAVSDELYGDEVAGRAVIEMIKEWAEWASGEDWYRSLRSDVGSLWRVDTGAIGSAFLRD